MMNLNFSPATLLAALFIGTLSAYLGYRRKRNPYLWFFVGFLFGVFGILAIFFAPQLKSKKKLNASEPVPPVVVDPLASLGPKDKFWYYLDPNYHQQGPMSLEALKGAWKEGKVNPLTYVWHEELADWKPLRDLLAPSPLQNISE